MKGSLEELTDARRLCRRPYYRLQGREHAVQCGVLFNPQPEFRVFNYYELVCVSLSLSFCLELLELYEGLVMTGHRRSFVSLMPLTAECLS